MESSDAHDLEVGSEKLVDLRFARGIDKGIDIDRHARPDVKRKRVSAADDVAHTMRTEDFYQLGEHRLHGRAVGFHQEFERVHAPLWRTAMNYIFGRACGRPDGGAADVERFCRRIDAGARTLAKFLT